MGLPGDPGGDVAWMTRSVTPCSPHSQPAWPSRARGALCVYRQTVEDQRKQRAHVSLHSSCATWPSGDYLASQIPGRSAGSCQCRALGEEEEEDPEPPKGSEPPRRTAPHTPRQAGSTGLSHPRQGRQKAPSGGYRESLG